MHANNVKSRFGRTYESSIASGIIKDQTSRIFVRIFFIMRLDRANAQSRAISSSRGIDTDMQDPSTTLRLTELKAIKISSLCKTFSDNCLLRIHGMKHKIIDMIETENNVQIIRWKCTIYSILDWLQFLSYLSRVYDVAVSARPFVCHTV